MRFVLGHVFKSTIIAMLRIKLPKFKAPEISKEQFKNILEKSEAAKPFQNHIRIGVGLFLYLTSLGLIYNLTYVATIDHWGTWPSVLLFIVASIAAGIIADRNFPTYLSLLLDLLFTGHAFSKWQRLAFTMILLVVVGMFATWIVGTSVLSSETNSMVLQGNLEQIDTKARQEGLSASYRVREDEIKKEISSHQTEMQQAVKQVRTNNPKLLQLVNEKNAWAINKLGKLQDKAAAPFKARIADLQKQLDETRSVGLRSLTALVQQDSTQNAGLAFEWTTTIAKNQQYFKYGPIIAFVILVGVIVLGSLWQFIEEPPSPTPTPGGGSKHRNKQPKQESRNTETTVEDIEYEEVETATASQRNAASTRVSDRNSESETAKAKQFHETISKASLDKLYLLREKAMGNIRANTSRMNKARHDGDAAKQKHYQSKVQEWESRVGEIDGQIKSKLRREAA